MNPAMVLALVLVAIISVIVVAIAIFTRGRNGLLDKDKYRILWLEIENGLDKNNLTTYQFAVLSANKLLSQVLDDLGSNGDSMSDRLKNVKSKISNFSAVLAAHKLRNKIAHETDINVSAIDARRALATFKKTLKDLGAI